MVSDACAFCVLAFSREAPGSTWGREAGIGEAENQGGRRGQESSGGPLHPDPRLPGSGRSPVRVRTDGHQSQTHQARGGAEPTGAATLLPPSFLLLWAHWYHLMVLLPGQRDIQGPTTTLGLTSWPFKTAAKLGSQTPHPSSTHCTEAPGWHRETDRCAGMGGQGCPGPSLSQLAPSLLV